MSNNVRSTFFMMLLLMVFIHGSLSCKENTTVYPYEKIKEFFDLHKYQEFDLLDYMSIESGLAYLYEKKVNADVDYIELFLFSSMEKIIYHVYRENDIWFILRDVYTYKEPYNTEHQTISSLMFKIITNDVFYIKPNGEIELANGTDTKTINRILNVVKKIIKD